MSQCCWSQRCRPEVDTGGNEVVFLDKLFSRKRTGAGLDSDRERQAQLALSLHGQADIQTAAEQQAVRERMEAELTTQRERRLPTS